MSVHSIQRSFQLYAMWSSDALVLEHFNLFTFRDAMQLLELAVTDQLLAVDLANWLDFNFPSRELSPAGNITSHLAKGLGIEEQVFCTPENAMICQAWICKQHLVAANYGMDLVLVGAPTDELFLWLMAQAMEVAILVVHMGGLWTSKAGSEVDIDDDIFLVYTTGFMHLLPQVVPGNAIVFQAPDNNWTCEIPVLEGLVCNVAGMLGNTGFVPKTTEPPQSLLKMLSHLAGVTQQQYRQCLIKWLEDFLDFPVIWEWLTHQNMSWEQYRDHLESCSTPDGLELVVSLMAMWFHLNLVHAGGLWSMRAEGSQNTDLTLLWTEEGVIFCDWWGEDSDMDDDLVVMHQGKRVLVVIAA